MIRIMLVKIIIITMVLISQANAGISDKLIFNFGGSFGRAKISGKHIESISGTRINPNVYYRSVSNLTKIYGMHIETMYPFKRNLAIGFGFQYLFNSQDMDYYDYPTFQDDYDNRKPRDEYSNRFTNVKVYLPYLTALYQFRILNTPIVARLNAGICYALVGPYLNNYDTGDKGAFGISLVPSLGKTFKINERFGLLIEGGYRFIRTGKIGYNENIIIWDYVYINRLDLSGVFLRSSFSFGGR